jgi:hypothetical protein
MNEMREAKGAFVPAGAGAAGASAAPVVREPVVRDDLPWDPGGEVFLDASSGEEGREASRAVRPPPGLLRYYRNHATLLGITALLPAGILWSVSRFLTSPVLRGGAALGAAALALSALVKLLFLPQEWERHRSEYRRWVLREELGAAPGPESSALPGAASQPSGVLRPWARPAGPGEGTLEVAWTDPRMVPWRPLVLTVDGEAAGWVWSDPASVVLALPAGRRVIRAEVGGACSEPLEVELPSGGCVRVETRKRFGERPAFSFQSEPVVALRVAGEEQETVAVSPASRENEAR